MTEHNECVFEVKVMICLIHLISPPRLTSYFSSNAAFFPLSSSKLQVCTQEHAELNEILHTNAEKYMQAFPHFHHPCII